MNNSHRLITALVATGALLIGSAISSSVVAQTRPSTGQDGDKLAGVASPTPRFVDNGNGTVTDKLTGLIWLKNANCFGEVNWQTALNNANSLANGHCGLTDNSTAGQWRLPNLAELGKPD